MLQIQSMKWFTSVCVLYHTTCVLWIYINISHVEHTCIWLTHSLYVFIMTHSLYVFIMKSMLKLDVKKQFYFKLRLKFNLCKWLLHLIFKCSYIQIHINTAQIYCNFSHTSWYLKLIRKQWLGNDISWKKIKSQDNALPIVIHTKSAWLMNYQNLWI